MLAICHFFWELCFFRRSPGELPASNFVLGFLLAGLVAIALLALWASPNDSRSLALRLGSLLSGIGMQGLVTWALLQFMGHGERFRETWAALLGANAIIHLALLALNASKHLGLEVVENFANAATVVCLVWWLAIAGHVYRQAAGVGAFLGAFIAFATEVLGWALAYAVISRAA